MAEDRRLGSLTRSLTFTIPGKPVPASRPRVTSGHVYYPRRYADWLLDATIWARRAFGTGELWDGPCILEAWFYGLAANADIDNALKAVLDCTQGTIVVNDRQYREVHAFRESYIGDDGPCVRVKVRKL